MKNKSVAILDIRSNEISFLLGSKGVNGTFAFSDSRSECYEGFSSNGFHDEQSLRRAIHSVITSVKENFGGKIDKIYVGVPSTFTKVLTKGHTISFSSKRKVCMQDIEWLYQSGLNELLAREQCIRRSAMYFTLVDNRKYFSPEEVYGVSTTTLKGALCYYFVSDYFYALLTETLSTIGFSETEFIPSSLAQTNYLFSEKRREGYAFLLDVGFLTTTFSVVYGNGIVHEESFDFGAGIILVALMNALEVEYETAEEILYTANVSGGSVGKEQTYVDELTGKQFSVYKINEVIKYTLDILCENIESFLAKYYKDKTASALIVNPIGITGEGIGYIKGGAEHISKRLNRLTEIIYPDLPYYDKPAFSSRIALLNAAISKQKKTGWIYKIFHRAGGKK
ncbi:MAG: hypothetical protein IJF64_04360 [Clostridia bacterium]|nr:hypothetical protein [Clostridia bacterium]